MPEPPDRYNITTGKREGDKMHLYEIHYTFKAAHESVGKGTGFAQARTAEAAEAAFRADYPATPRFDYKITKVIVSATNFR